MINLTKADRFHCDITNNITVLFCRETSFCRETDRHCVVRQTGKRHKHPSTGNLVKDN